MSTLGQVGCPFIEVMFTDGSVGVHPRDVVARVYVSPAVYDAVA